MLCERETWSLREKVMVAIRPERAIMKIMSGMKD